MSISDVDFEKRMEEYGKSKESIHLSDEAKKRIYREILQESENRESAQGANRTKALAAIALAATIAVLVVFGTLTYTLSKQKSGQMISCSVLEGSEIQSEITKQTEKTEMTEETENIENTENTSDSDENNSDKIWLTAAQLLDYYESETGHNVQTCAFVSYNGTLMCSTDSDASTLHFKRDGDGEIIYNEENAYDAYLVEEMENAIAIVVDGHVCVYEEMEDIIFTIDGISYGISYALYDLIGTEEHSGKLIAEEDGVKVYEWLDADGQAVDGKYFVDISDILVELMPDPYADGEDWAEFYWVAECVVNMEESCNEEQ